MRHHVRPAQTSVYPSRAPAQLVQARLSDIRVTCGPLVAAVVAWGRRRINGPPGEHETEPLYLFGVTPSGPYGYREPMLTLRLTGVRQCGCCPSQSRMAFRPNTFSASPNLQHYAAQYCIGMASLTGCKARHAQPVLLYGHWMKSRLGGQ